VVELRLELRPDRADDGAVGVVDRESGGDEQKGRALPRQARQA
jgi:hypothetical protein